MGIADMLIKMKVKYGSEDAVNICDMIASSLFNNSLDASRALAVVKGKTFPKYSYHDLACSDFYTKNIWPSLDKKIKRDGIYNSQLLTIAPTGTLSTMLGISGGIEPIFANYYERKTESLHGEDKYYKVYTPIVDKYMKEHDLTDESQLPEYFVTARDIGYMNRIKMQGAWQRYIDASISSTINLPESATPEEVMDIYIEAWKAGLKGITVFREGCRRAAILTTGEHKEVVVEAPMASDELPRGHVIETSDTLVGRKRKLITGCGSLHINAWFDPVTGDLRETFFVKGSKGGCARNLDGISRLCSLSARAGVSVHDIVDQLLSIDVCGSYVARTAVKHDTSKGRSCPNAIGHALLGMWEEMQKELGENTIVHTFSNEICEETHTFSMKTVLSVENR